MTLLNINLIKCQVTYVDLIRPLVPFILQCLLLCLTLALSVGLLSYCYATVTPGNYWV